MKFGDKIKRERTRRDMTIDQLASELGISRRTLCNYEQGNTYPKQRGFYKKLAEYFGMDINYFLTEDEEFLTEVAERYGRRGLSQAKSMLVQVSAQVSALFAGGDLSDDDKEAFLHEIQGIYLDSKKRAQKFTPKKYRKADNEE